MSHGPKCGTIARGNQATTPWRRAVEAAASLGCQVLEWETDPHAEPFYERMGAVRVGQRESSLFPGRMLPVMRYKIADRSINPSK